MDVLLFNFYELIFFHLLLIPQIHQTLIDGHFNEFVNQAPLIDKSPWLKYLILHTNDNVDTFQWQAAAPSAWSSTSAWISPSAWLPPG